MLKMNYSKSIITKKAMVDTSHITQEDLDLMGMTRAEFERSLIEEQRYIIAWSKTVNPNNL